MTETAETKGFLRNDKKKKEQDTKKSQKMGIIFERFN